MGNEMKDIYWETILITLGEQIYNLEAKKYRALEQKYEPRPNETYEESKPYDA